MVEPLFMVVEGLLACVDEAVAEVGAVFSLVRQMLALVGDAVALVGDCLASPTARFVPVMSIIRRDRVRCLGRQAGRCLSHATSVAPSTWIVRGERPWLSCR